MRSQDYLQAYQKKAEKFLDSFFAQKEKQAEEVSPLAQEMVKALHEYTKGGKKVRGALTVLGYQASGGRDSRKILSASCGMELFHNFLLVHDDLIDRDQTRRGSLTIHEYYKRLHEQRYKKSGSVHYGSSMAILAGDLGSFLAWELLVTSNFSKERVVKAAHKLSDLLVQTAYGEIFDITSAFHDELSFDDILMAKTYKTAYYTVVLPLTIGAILAGAGKRKLTAFEAFGVPVGVAFQLQDDILGVFGQKEQTGKSVEGDIREGKKTFIFAKAMELANSEQKRFLRRHYGRKNATPAQIKKVKQIFEDTGALKFSEQLASDLVEKGKKNVYRITRKKKYAQVLSSFADFVIQRDR